MYTRSETLRFVEHLWNRWEAREKHLPKAVGFWETPQGVGLVVQSAGFERCIFWRGNLHGNHGNPFMGFFGGLASLRLRLTAVRF